MLAINDVTAGYGNIPVLHGVSLNISKGEIVTLIGANGAGKTTLMMTIFGRPRATNGNVLFEGVDITDLPTHRIAQLCIAQSPEGRRIFPRLTVLENLQMGALIANDPHGFDKDLDRVCALFPVLKQRKGQRGGTLSGGEQQMLAIARALMGRPKLLLLDEPSLGLAPLIVKQIFETIKELNRQGLTVFLVEQNAYHALKLAHRGYVMVNGKITMSGTGRELLEAEEVKAAYLEGGAHGAGGART
ncbi:MAG TPA: ABC transporter ATP-binding protein [Methyloceanibacter sp.]|nr:ABC transporter ATP-binding protein [Methyloceanibacter sp.]